MRREMKAGDGENEISDEIQEYILSEVNSSYLDNRVGVTELGGCIRKAWYRRRKPMKMDFSSAIRMFIGKLFHLYIEKDYEQTEVFVTHNVGKGVIVGKIDAIVGDTAIDFKSKRNLNSISQYGPLLRDKNQVQFYAYMADLQRAKLVYYKVDPSIRSAESVDEFVFNLKRDIVLEVMNGERISFEIKMHDLSDVVRDYVTKALILFDSLEDDRPPDPDAQPWECRFCEFRNICEYAHEQR